MSTKEEEAADPTAADGLYQSAIDWLLEQTRDTRKFGMLLNENIDYGFRRNLLGLKPIALVVSIATFFANIAVLWVNFGTSETRVLAGYGLGVGLAAIILVWIFLVDESFVEDGAASYAKRLLAQLENLVQRKPSFLQNTDKPPLTTVDLGFVRPFVTTIRSGSQLPLGNTR